MGKSFKSECENNVGFCTGKRTVPVVASKFPSSVCRRGVENKFILYVKCNSWVHKKCYEIRKYLSRAVDFVCRKCSGSTCNVDDEKGVTLDSNVIENVTKIFISGRCPYFWKRSAKSCHCKYY